MCVQRHVLQLMSDNSLRDCLRDKQRSHSGDVGQDYSQHGRRKMVSLLILNNGGWWWLSSATGYFMGFKCSLVLKIGCYYLIGGP